MEPPPPHSANGMATMLLLASCAFACQAQTHADPDKAGCVAGCGLAAQTLKRGAEATANVIKMEDEDFHSQRLSPQQLGDARAKFMSITTAMSRACAELECRRALQDPPGQAACAKGCALLFQPLY
jgi:hypothetical protein